MRIGVLVSGNGSGLQALIDKSREPTSHFSIAVVVSSHPDAFALQRAERAQIPHHVLKPKDYASREAYDKGLLDFLKPCDVELVVLAGFMRILTPAFLDAFPMRVINVHPALCPAFPGMHAAKQALDHGVKVTGCTVHFVDSGTDTGPIIAQAAVPVIDGDTEQSLHTRIQVQEHLLLQQVVEGIAQKNG